MEFLKEDFQTLTPDYEIGLRVYEGIIYLCLYDGEFYSFTVCNWKVNGHEIKHEHTLEFVVFVNYDYGVYNTHFNVSNIYSNATISFEVHNRDDIYTVKREDGQWSYEVKHFHHVEDYIPNHTENENNYFLDADGNEYSSYDDYFDSLVEISPDIKSIHKNKISCVSYRVDDENDFYIFYECKSMVKDADGCFNIYCALYNKRGKIKAQDIEFVNCKRCSKSIVEHRFYNEIKFNEISKIYIYIK